MDPDRYSTSSATWSMVVDVFAIDDDQLKCPICGYFFKMPVRLDCGHSFCKNCIDKWLRSCNSCSICRQPTLQPRRNTDLEKIMEKRKPTSSASVQSNFFERTFLPIKQKFFSKPKKEVRQLQRESIRASIRRKKKVNPEIPKIVEENENQKENRPKPGLERNLLRKSIRRIKNML
ncbi:unnamed protein product [Bursaphelenchus okinawaensis]|uniref:RING-type domain-containing protein n=1 Tax=Bursaphelenchus okinawaensis TaxID=465554 RepID=A0A811JRK6_9BILA|nr:unnamed protein product [Bursaphelenchus okinawaensis]CAG9079907.1 unnamed protein product [Bursaphelenchus okinawaensis]